MEQNESEQVLLKQMIRSGEEIPEKFLRSPELNIGLQLYLTAFFDLDSERSHGMGPTPIPLVSILQYAQAYDFDEEQSEDLIYFVKALDAKHLKRIEEQQKRDSSKGKLNARSARPRKRR